MLNQKFMDDLKKMKEEVEKTIQEHDIQTNHVKYIEKTFLQPIDLDEERKYDLRNNNGFRITSFNNVKSALDDTNSIYSTKFGRTLNDVDSFTDRYKCKCGKTTGTIKLNQTCPHCETIVKMVDDDFNYTGWLVLDNDAYVIHPNMYEKIASFIGKKKLKNIIQLGIMKDTNGKIMKDREGNYILEQSKSKKGAPKEPYSGIGITKFREKFVEIMNYYLKANSKKEQQYYDIMKNKKLVFTQSIPVFTIHLRQYNVSKDKEVMSYSDINDIYSSMSNLVVRLNKLKGGLYRNIKTQECFLYEIQSDISDLYQEVISIVKDKKGEFRSLYGGRYNYTGRGVITPDPLLKVDEIAVSYFCLVELLQQQIINILEKSYSKPFNEAYDMWFRASIKISKPVWEIIQSIIDHNNGITVLLNRNPTIEFGGILTMKIVRIEPDHNIAVALQILGLVAGDFDGDALNLRYIINKEFKQLAIAKLSPKNSMFIDRNTGLLNSAVNHGHDIVINMNTLLSLGRKSYSPEQIKKIEMCKNMNRRSA